MSIVTEVTEKWPQSVRCSASTTDAAAPGEKRQMCKLSGHAKGVRMSVNPSNAHSAPVCADVTASKATASLPPVLSLLWLSLCFTAFSASASLYASALLTLDCAGYRSPHLGEIPVTKMAGVVCGTVWRAGVEGTQQQWFADFAHTGSSVHFEHS